MGPSKHLMVSTILALLLLATTQHHFVLPVVFGAGWLVDFDHYIEFLANKGLRKWSAFQEFLDSTQFDESGRIILLFHGYEHGGLLFILYVLSEWNIVFGALFLAYSIHLVMDVVGNRHQVPLFYFFTYRFLKRFNHAQLTTQKA